MPLYEYECRACATTFERLSTFAQADTAVACPHCGQTARRRLSTFVAVSRSAGGATQTVAGGCACSRGGGCACCG